MTWTGASFRSKHNKKLSPTELRETGDEAKAIRIANSKVKTKKRKGKR